MREAHYDMLVVSCPSCRTIAPVQDLLGLDTRARMNVPGTTDGNWRWRLRRGQLKTEQARTLRAMTREAARA